MQFSIIALLSIASVAIASPASRGVQARSLRMLSERTVSQAAQGCDAKQVISCCNQDNESSGSGLLGGVLSGNLLNLNCIGLSVNVLSVADSPANEICGNNVVACCDGKADSGTLDENAQCNQV
ncbi:hypothetical protein T440DRAFT_513574 [Plenodomus tracheiphilus IPT5]|uniref:Hydrophobin n=1 Tax=Plenodomus tracheiphilus IPT5 TaxID=1408161 RepID=A0A6A7BMS9_9PLEO|nr:hypothetical protein T440DRAFT_513574 [Plenodomus tracheiphilus IPT5]